MQAHEFQNDCEWQANFSNRVRLWVEGAQRIINEHYATNFPSLVPDVLEVQPGKRYVKVVKKTPGQSGGSAYAFIDSSNGDVLKPASWKAPAKHARGNVFADDNGLTNVGPYGPAYMK